MMPSDDVGNNAKTTDKRLGGITGKGFMPGVSGNPSGRPSRRRMSERYEELIEQPLPEDLRVALKLQQGATYGDAIALGQARAAIKGKTDAAREIADRVDGRARQQMELSGPGGDPIEITERLVRARERRLARAAEQGGG